MADPEVHFEPFLHLAGLGDGEALIAWGGFYFRRRRSPYGDWRIVDDEELGAGMGRTETIGARSEPFGDAVVEVERHGRVVARAETGEHNHVWVGDLEPDTEYRYRVQVDGESWAEGERWDWDSDRSTLRPMGRSYDNRIRTFPAAETVAPVAFAAIGDFGVGIFAGDGKGERQLRLARALERVVDAYGVKLIVTTGDNVYIGPEDTVQGSGGEDDDWYASFYEPYRYLLNRVPFFPAVGNHDTSDSDTADDRDQLDDNLFLQHRFKPEVDARRASLDPGLFYRFEVGANVEFVCIDTSLADELAVEHYFDDPRHRDWVRDALQRTPDGRPSWRIPFMHHPPYCAGPKHGSTPGMVERLVPLFHEAGARLVLSGHEHNFQHSLVDGVHYLVSGAGGKLRNEPPTDFERAGTQAWASEGHFLLVEVDERQVVVHPVRDVAESGAPVPVALRDPTGRPVKTPIEIRR